MIRVGFIQPSSDYLHDPFRGDPLTHFQILTILEDHFGSQIEAILIDLRGIKREFAIYHIPECDLYLHSVYTLDYEEQVSIVRFLREAYPKAIHVAGGPHVASFQKESLTIFDSLVIGEGERVILDVVHDLMSFQLQPIYRQAGPIDINDYPVWRRNFLPKSITARKGMMTLRKRGGYEELIGTTVMFSRGCPYHCHFCALTQARESSPGIRYRSPARIREEIEYLKCDYGIQGVVLQDEICFPLNQKKAIAHLEAIGSKGIFWRGQCRVDGVTEEIAALARQAGCIALGLGVESVNQRSLDIINKRTTITQARTTIELLKKNDIEVRIYMIIGLPGEPEDIVEKTWAFINETDPDLVALSLFAVRPGTEVFCNPVRFGIKRILNDWSKMMHMHSRYSNNERPTLTFEYEQETPWGKGMPSEIIIDNYLELQKRLREKGLSNPMYLREASSGKC